MHRGHHRAQHPVVHDHDADATTVPFLCGIECGDQADPGFFENGTAVPVR
jgi:hypothetical protein